MPDPTWLATGGPSFYTGLGSVLTGVSEILLALGAGVGFLIRYRQNARRTELQNQRNAEKAAAAERERLDKQYAERMEQYEETIDRMEKQDENKTRMYEEKLTNLQNLNTRLVNQILKANERHDKDKQS